VQSPTPIHRLNWAGAGGRKCSARLALHSVSRRTAFQPRRDCGGPAGGRRGPLFTACDLPKGPSFGKALARAYSPAACRPTSRLRSAIVARTCSVGPRLFVVGRGPPQVPSGNRRPQRSGVCASQRVRLPELCGRGKSAARHAPGTHHAESVQLARAPMAVLRDASVAKQKRAMGSSASNQIAAADRFVGALGRNREMLHEGP
jgi:hypothetical protein